jgi:hypothetical protein
MYKELAKLETGGRSLTIFEPCFAETADEWRKPPAKRVADLNIWGVSSAGLEHYLDRVGVGGSNPPHPTFFVVELLSSKVVESMVRS